VNLHGAGGWLGSGAAVITIGACVLTMTHRHRFPSATHPWTGRLIIALMYCAGCALVVTPAGEFITGIERDATRWLGGVSTGLGWAAVTIAVLFLLAAITVALIWEPDPGIAYAAAGTPFLACLAGGGIAASAYQLTAVPAQQAVASLARLLGG